MFKKGQLVRTRYSGYYGVIKRVSDKANGLYYVTNTDQALGLWYRERELILIGNNFKFKGAK